MCGIGGFSWRDADKIRAIMSLMQHRGPDGEGYFVDGRVSLGHKRLSIIDLSDSGAQPMYNEDKSVVIVYNGETYNYIELREALSALGHKFSSKSDTEVIIHAYEEWGNGCLSKLNGMFAFCIYDLRKKRLFLARDRFGVKPLYYFYQKGVFIFASEIKPILEFENVAKEVNDNAVFDYLVYNCYDHLPETFFKDIFRLMPGSYMTYDLTAQKLEVSRWYDIPQMPAEMDFKSACDKFRELFLDSIRLRQRSDVEIGFCLSGGLDSSSIVCALNSRPQVFPRMRRQAFSVVFPGRDIDESGYINSVRAATHNFEFNFTTPVPQDLSGDIHDLINHQEEPFAATSIFAQWQVMKLAGRHRIKVLLDGQGSDELLAGYPFLYGFYFTELLSKINLSTLLSEVAGYMKFQTVNDGLLFALFLLAPKRLKPCILDAFSRQCVNQKFLRKHRFNSRVPELMYQRTSLNDALRRRVIHGLPLLLREEDKNSSAFSVETRLPFLDYRLVEFLFTLPASFKLKAGVTKHLLRESMSGFVPDRIRMRRSKFGFSTPMNDWMRERFITDIAGEALNSDFIRGYFNCEKFKRLIELHRTNRMNLGQSIWKLVNTYLWHKNFFA